MKTIALKEKIKDLERELDVRVKEMQLEAQKERLELKESLIYEHLNLQKELATEKAKNVGLHELFEKSSYQQLSDILKALVVKLPTLNIKELPIHIKAKGD